MLEEILPQTLLMAIKQNYNLNNVYEIRMRLNKPLVLNYFGKYVFAKNKYNERIMVSKNDIEAVISTATNNSLYAFNGQLKQGFITARGGIRIGVGGEVVLDDNFSIKTIKNPSSLNIRIPHQIKNCAHTALCYILNGTVHSTLILAPPGAGKTTFLKDICANMSGENRIYQTLICDERYEIASVFQGEIFSNIGDCSDVISGATKDFAFKFGVRSMKPDVIVCDEIMGQNDATSIISAINSGVSVIATAHAKNISDALNRKDLKTLLEARVFKRIVVLSSKNGPGTYEGIYNENLVSIYKNGE